MLRFIMVVMVLLVMMVAYGHAASVNKVVGVSADATGSPAPIPLTITSLCISGCPLMTQPSFTDANRVWGSSGGACRTSTNGGSTWASCLTQPFSSGGMESYAGAADGSVIGTARVVFDCTIKRSTDNGLNWSTVYVAVGETCGGPVTEQTQVKCRLDGSCDFVYINAASAFVVVRTTDNGQNWGVVFTLGAGAAATVQSYTLTEDGGYIPPITTSFRGISAVGTGWTVTAAFPAGTGTCWGGFLLVASPRSSCYVGPGATYEFRDGNSGLLVFSTVIPGATAFAGTGGVAFGLNATTIYFFAAWQPPSGTAPIGVWVSTNSGQSFTLLGVGNIAANSMRGGDVWRSPLNGCIYLSAGSTSQFLKVC